MNYNHIVFSKWEPLSQSPDALAVFCFATGLIATEIVNAVENFTKPNQVKNFNANT